MKIIFLSLFIYLCGQAKAIDCPAYIINLSGDTVKGIIEIKTLYEKPFKKKEVVHFPRLETQIKFAEGDGKKKKLDEEDMKGFGFMYENEWYHFIFLDLKRDKVKNGVGGFIRDVSLFTKFFVRRTDEGYLTVYKHYFQPDPSSNRSFMKEYIGSDWIGQVYVKHPDLGYIDIAPMEMSKRDFKKFLMQELKMEDEYVNTIPAKKNWDEAEEVLKSYNVWKKNKK